MVVRRSAAERRSRTQKGTSTTMPKKPYTMEGMPASSSTSGLRKR